MQTPMVSIAPNPNFSSWLSTCSRISVGPELNPFTLASILCYKLKLNKAQFVGIHERCNEGYGPVCPFYFCV